LQNFGSKRKNFGPPCQKNVPLFSVSGYGPSLSTVSSSKPAKPSVPFGGW